MKPISRNTNFFNKLKLSHNDFSIIIAHALDYYDTALYSFLAPVLAPLFFPEHEPVVQLILTYSTLASSSVTRPIGAFVFGMIARRLGAVKGLSYSLIGMALSSIFIGVLPGFTAIGWTAALLLVAARMWRGFFAAGESTIARLYVLENKSTSHALTISHFYQSSAMLGMLLASVAATLAILFPLKGLLWRVFFCLSGLSGVLVYFLRRSEFNKYNVCQANLNVIDKLLSIKSCWEYRGNVLRTALVTSFSYITYVVPFVFMNTFIPLITSISLETMMALNTTLVVFDAAMIPIVGYFLKKFESSTVMIVASIVLASTLNLFFANLPGSNLTYVTIVRVWVVFWGIVFLCPMNLWLKSLFEPKDQYLLVGMGTALGAGTIGRLTPAICLAIWYKTEISFLPTLYLTVLMMTVAFAIKSTKIEGGPLRTG